MVRQLWHMPPGVSHTVCASTSTVLHTVAMASTHAPSAGHLRTLHWGLAGGHRNLHGQTAPPRHVTRIGSL
jgi:hypothetical protein